MNPDQTAQRTYCLQYNLTKYKQMPKQTIFVVNGRNMVEHTVYLTYSNKLSKVLQFCMHRSKKFCQRVSNPTLMSFCLFCFS